jgi:hypothetical protein
MVFSVFSVFFGFFSVYSFFFSVFSVCFETVCFGVSVVSLLYQNREFRLIRNTQKTPPNSLKESIFGYFSENLGLFRLFRYRFETPKQTETFCYWFHETNRNKRETDLVSVCFGSNRNFFLFVSRTPYSYFTPSQNRSSSFKYKNLVIRLQVTQSQPFSI